MNAHRVEATLTQDSTLTLNNLPFHAGDAVEIIIQKKGQPSNGKNAYPLRGSVLRYDDPTEPVAAEDWDAVR